MGRPVTVILTDRRDEATPSASSPPSDIHSDVYSTSTREVLVDGDVVFEQVDHRYISGSTPAAHASLPDLAMTRRRTHDATDSDVGALSSLA